jgi:hypothetical protein
VDNKYTAIERAAISVTVRNAKKVFAKEVTG